MAVRLVLVIAVTIIMFMRGVIMTFLHACLSQGLNVGKGRNGIGLGLPGATLAAQVDRLAAHLQLDRRTHRTEEILVGRPR